MSAKHWTFHIDDKPWDDSRSLYIMRRGFPGGRALVRFEMVQPGPNGSVDGQPSLRESREDVQDNAGDVEGFLQGAMELAWEMGMRPKGFGDHTNELAAVRYHLEDMRALAKVPGAMTEEQMTEERGIALLDATDDGTEVWLTAYAGGSAVGGAFGSVEIARYRPDGTVDHRRLDAAGNWGPSTLAAALR